MTDQRPTSGPIHTFWIISNGHNSATRHPIDYVFGSKVDFQRGRMELRYFGFAVMHDGSWRLF